MRLLLSTAMAAALAVPAMAQGTGQQGDQDTQAQASQAAGAGQDQAIEGGKAISLDGWNYASLYAKGWSAGDFIDNAAVHGEDGDEIGEVEDLVVNPDGEITAVIAEVGGFWDIGDTHVSIPWDRVKVNAARDGVTVPLTEDNLDDFDLFAYSGLTEDQLGEQVSMGVDDRDLGPRAWRVSELIGDYARLRDGDRRAGFGYVNDVLIQDGKIAATVVDPARAYGGGRYAYPFQGYGDSLGWRPDGTWYDMPYDVSSANDLETFDYAEIEAD